MTLVAATVIIEYDHELMREWALREATLTIARRLLTTLDDEATAATGLTVDELRTLRDGTDRD